MLLTIGSRVHIIDNSGGRHGKCICIYKKNKSKFLGVGTNILISCVRAVKKKEAKTGTMYKAVLARCNNTGKFLGGHTIKCDNNAIVLLKPNGDLFASRISGLVSIKLRKFGFTKILSISDFIY